MSKLLCVVASVCLAASSAQAEIPNFCKNSPIYKPGEPIDGRFMGIPYVIMMHTLAEKYCGAAHISMKEKVLRTIRKGGCGPDTEIYASVERAIADAEGMDLPRIVNDGRANPTLSSKAVRQRAAAMAKDLGGCSTLLKVHDAVDLSADGK
ncbi:hypothetical protein [Rhizobium sp. BR 315]|uniref:hypothetical protein n=1 Tax=Rhizobium sp. BR 315 TaxID=3040014 RepID=UPI003D3520C5